MVNLAKLKGGAKEKWIKDNWSKIKGYYRKHGFARTRLKYHMKVYTLQRHLEERQLENRGVDIKGLEDIKMEILRTDVQQLRGEVRGMKEDYSMFVESVATQVAEVLVAPLLRYGIHLPDELNSEKWKDPLSISSLKLKRVGKS